MNSLLIIALSSLSGLIVGVFITRTAKEREEYYDGIKKLCSFLISNISFKADKITKILGNAHIVSWGLKKNVEEFFEYVNGGELRIINHGLKKEEHAEIKEFFSQLGRYDGETQVTELKKFESLFAQKYNEIKSVNEKQSNMYIKLGLLTGLLVGILLI